MARRRLRLVRHALGNAARRADRHHRGGAATALGSFNVTLPGAVERHRVYLPSESRYLKRPVIHPHADTVDPGDTTKDEEDKPQDGSRPPQG